MIERDARQELDIAYKTYVLVQGRNVRTGPGKELLIDNKVTRSFLGG
ncbi:hypothetical protein [Yoonia sp. SS1-5]|uniref:Uncharacterized protein n=1 Tax=Yoonia rhodophyticola TaxID=3137370 RepID=A0ABZ3JD11_9RHOB